MSIATLQYRPHHDLLHSTHSPLSESQTYSTRYYSRTSAGLSRSAFYAIDVRLRALRSLRVSAHAPDTTPSRMPCVPRCGRAMRSLGLVIDAQHIPRCALRAPRITIGPHRLRPRSYQSCGGRRRLPPTAAVAQRKKPPEVPCQSPLCTCCPMADAGCGGGDSCGGRKGSSGGCSISPLCMFCRFGAGEMGDAGSAGAARASSRASASGAGCG